MIVCIARDGQEIGQHPEEAVPQLIANGEVLPTDHYWCEGMTEWGLIGERWPAEPALPVRKAGPVLRAPAPQAATPSGSTNRRLPIILGVVALLVLGAAAYFYFAKPAAVPPVETEEPASAAAEAKEPTPATTETKEPAPATAEVIPPADSSRTISVVAWNIEWYPGKSIRASAAQRESHKEIVKAELEKLNPDIFLGQEIRSWNDFIDLCRAVPDLQAAAVSRFLHREDVGLQQTAIASKLPAVSVWFDNWRPAKDQPPRGYTAAVLQIPGTDKLLLVYSLHLKSNLARRPEDEQANYRQREESVRQLLAHIQRMENEAFKGKIAAVIVGGDFNTNHDEQFGDNVVKMMTDAGFANTWGATPRKDRHTWRGNDRFEPTTFDYVFVRGLKSSTAQLVEVSDDTSDHWPVKIELSLP
jgi:endonuclease/exonuclease/phosphatase family metal-dependent hydrolase